MRRLVLISLISPLYLAAPSLAGAAQPTSEARVMETDEASRLAARLASELQSPFCPGKTLTTCTSSAAFDVRQEMAAWYAQGKSTEEIIALLSGRYGPQIANPPQPWFTVLIPYSPLVLGAFVVFLFVRRNLRRLGDEQAPPVAEEGPDLDRLKRLRRQVAADDD